MGKAAKSKAAKSKESGGASSSNSSPKSSISRSESGSSRERVGTYDLLNLVKIWDNLEEVRDSVRADHNLVRTVHIQEDQVILKDEYVEGNVANAKANQVALVPLLEIMGANDRLLPNLDNLIQCIDAFYRKAKKTRNLEHCYQQAWAFRRLIQVVKGYCYKSTPPEDWTQLYL